MSITNTDDIIDIREVIERVEELQELEERDEEEREELAAMLALLADCKGLGGDEQWLGEWYPVTLVRDTHWQTYAQTLAEEIGAISTDAKWPNNCIDWEQAARELRMDYTSVEFAGITYWTR